MRTCCSTALETDLETGILEALSVVEAHTVSKTHFMAIKATARADPSVQIAVEVVKILKAGERLRSLMPAHEQIPIRPARRPARLQSRPLALMDGVLADAVLPEQP